MKSGLKDGRMQAVVRRSGISNIRLQYRNGTPSAREFAPPKQKLNCMEECETCKSGKKSNQCLRKNAVYEITCSHCGILYIGETGRTIGTRIKEHLTMEKQTVYKHLESHKETGYEPNIMI